MDQPLPEETTPIPSDSESPAPPAESETNPAVPGEAASNADQPPTAPEPAVFAGSSITGQIRNALPGAQLSLTGRGETRTAAVGPDGVYGFTNLSAGEYALSLVGGPSINSAINLDGQQAIVVDYAVPSPVRQNKVFNHYLLFGPGNQPSTLTHLILALDYIVRFAPLVGFSPEEARNARRVTIMGDTNAVSTAVEQSLREAGCRVGRIAAADSYALENLLKQMVASGNPYPR